MRGRTVPAMQASAKANLHALGAIALWAALASLGVTLRHVPPFLLTGIALVIGSLPAWPLVAPAGTRAAITMSADSPRARSTLEIVVVVSGRPSRSASA